MSQASGSTVFFRNISKIIVVSSLLSMGLAACSDSGDEKVKPAEAVDVLYNRAQDELADSDYKAAVEDFEEVERQYPYSEWAKRAQIMSAYTSYKADEYDDAVATIERFVKFYPSDSSTPYAYYLKALCYYQQISDVGRDQKMTEFALNSLNEVVQRFPNTEYARDAKIKLDLTYDHLAGKEMAVGMYYLKRQEYLAAINRFRKVVDSYQTTAQVPEALHRLVEAYLALGVVDEAKRNAAVLGYNFPNSKWYRYSYALLNGGSESGEPKEEGFWGSLF